MGKSDFPEAAQPSYRARVPGRTRISTAGRPRNRPMPYPASPPKNQPVHNRAKQTAGPHMLRATGISTTLDRNATMADNAARTTKATIPHVARWRISTSAASNSDSNHACTGASMSSKPMPTRMARAGARWRPARTDGTDLTELVAYSLQLPVGTSPHYCDHTQLYSRRQESAVKASSRNLHLGLTRSALDSAAMERSMATASIVTLPEDRNATRFVRAGRNGIRCGCGGRGHLRSCCGLGCGPTGALGRPARAR